ncbi:ABC transporter substrate-binding protein [Marinomonas ostreistagni]|uniref:ABC transporter substrate-binding protein n=1 Tax=Marinomonas ostreistagni TaxID=359209 RepID=A0ABS0Z7M5_9GAMM|nr:ABC transporter substrate-binding protein [Marinomonas ostreistagni]MBJ7549661.1 ABC transporter substrate-binding protein [Marinomonas ostreistagni]
MKALLLSLMLLVSLCPVANAAQLNMLPSKESNQVELNIWGAANFDAIEPLLKAYQAQSPDTTIVYVEHSSLELFNRVLSIQPTDKKPDVIMSPAMDLQFKLVNDGYAMPYRSEVTDALPQWAKWRDEAFGFTFEPIVMVINQDILGNLAMPESREALLSLIRERSPLVQGKVGLSDIETVGLGYLTWFHDSQQSRTYGRLLEAFGSHHAQLYPNSSAMLQALLRGDIFIAYNVLGSYAFEWSQNYPWIRTVMPTDYTSVVMRTAFIYHEASNMPQAEFFLDYLLSDDGQNILATASSLIPLSESVTGTSSLSEIRRRPHGIFRPIPFGLPLLVQTDQAKRSLLLEEWRHAMRIGP